MFNFHPFNTDLHSSSGAPPSPKKVTTYLLACQLQLHGFVDEGQILDYHNLARNIDRKLISCGKSLTIILYKLEIIYLDFVRFRNPLKCNIDPSPAANSI